MTDVIDTIPMDPVKFIDFYFSTPSGSPMRSSSRMWIKSDYKTDFERYSHAANLLNRARLLPDHSFATIREQTSESDPLRVWTALWPNDSKPPPTLTADKASSKDITPLLLSAMDLPVICQEWWEPLSERPFGTSQWDTEPMQEKRKKLQQDIVKRLEPILQYQQRAFCFALLFFGHAVRILRIDRSGIIATKLIDCHTGKTSLLYEFLRRYSRASLEQRGVDPTVDIIPHDSALAQEMRRRAEARAGESEGAAYARSLFAQSLNERWPWWRYRVDDATRGERSFLAAQPHTMITSTLIGRGTRGYIALDAADLDAPPVFFKDTWRYAEANSKVEGTTLATLNQAGVRFIPTLVCHGDVAEQYTQTLQYWKASLGYWHAYSNEKKPQEYVHYRMVVKEVCKRFKEFSNSRMLAYGFWCCITAHADACKLDIIHGDISNGNLMFHYDDATETWCGLLIDWEIARRMTLADDEDALAASVGTLQFKSMAVSEGRIENRIEDELESFFWVFISFVLRFLPHNAKDLTKLYEKLFTIKSDHSWFAEFKAECVYSGDILAQWDMSFKILWQNEGEAAVVNRSHPLNAVYGRIMSWLHQHRHRFSPKPPGHEALSSHDAILDLFKCASTTAEQDWPVADKTADQLVVPRKIIQSPPPKPPAAKGRKSARLAASATARDEVLGASHKPEKRAARVKACKDSVKARKRARW
ncbi:hypothetical protein C8Q79DRAFT_927449 [Trametes meyenii]|nr:hypothetical protein C8Q79DRAFT_927449 [Trametes meyenii]